MVLLVPAGASQILIDDAEGDGGVEAWAAATGDPILTPKGGSIDLVSLSVHQEGPALVFEVAQAEPLRQATPNLIVIPAAVAGNEFSLHMFIFRPFDDGRFPVEVIGTDTWYRTWGHVDEERNVWALHLLLPDLMRIGITPVDNDILSVQGAEAEALIVDTQPPTYRARELDRVPDGLDAEETLTLALDDRSVGGLALRSALPFRSSNGAATVFVYDLAATSGAEPATVSFEARDVPAGWQVVVPPPLHMDGPQNVTVLVALPSRHVHGTSESFLLRMAAGSDRLAETRLGVVFPQVPEPSGHHPLVRVAMIDSDDGIPPEGADVLVGNAGELSLTAGETSTDGEPIAARPHLPAWFWLARREEMTLGVDVDLSRTGTFTADLMSPIGMTDVEVAARVTFTAGTEGIVGEGSIAVGDLPRDERVPIEIALHPDVSADFVSAAAGAQMQLDVVLTGRRAHESEQSFYGAPHMYPGAAMTLPLLEYHDPVTQRFSRGDDLALIGNATARTVPDGTAVFAVEVRNSGTRAHDVALQTISTVTQPRLLGPDSFRLAPGDARTIHVAFDAPPSGQADAVLLATSQKDPEQRQALLLRAIVDPAGTNDAEAEAGLAEGPAKKSPAMAPVFVLGLVAALFALRR